MQAPASARLETVDVGGTSLAYVERGTGPAVLFIHGSGTYSATFTPVLDELPTSVRAIAYDRRAFGASPAPPARSLRRHVTDAASLIEALQAAPAVVVGSSAGGIVALRLAVDRPDLVSGLVLIEPAYQMALAPSAATSAALGRVLGRWLVRRDPDGAVRWFYRWATGYSHGGNQFDSYPEEWKRVAIGHGRATLRELTQIGVPLPTRSSLGRISVPTRVVIGDAGLPVFHRTARRALSAIPGAREVLAPGAAHLVYTDQPAICAHAIAEVVTSL